jgi:toxin secretion/phage lysis holin
MKPRLYCCGEEGKTRVEATFKWGLAALGSVAGYIFGGWHALMGVFLTLWVLDYISGMIASAMEGSLSSYKGLKGIGKKVLVAFLIAAAHFADMILSTGNIFRDAALFYFSMNELVSIIENCARAGIPIPSRLQRLVDVFREDHKKDKEEKR